MNFRQNWASYSYRDVSSLFVAVGGRLVCSPYHPHLFSSVAAAFHNPAATLPLHIIKLALRPSLRYPDWIAMSIHTEQGELRERYLRGFQITTEKVFNQAVLDQALCHTDDGIFL